MHHVLLKGFRNASLVKVILDRISVTFSVLKTLMIVSSWLILRNPLGEVSLYAQMTDRAGNQAPVSAHGILHCVILPMIVKH